MRRAVIALGIIACGRSGGPPADRPPTCPVEITPSRGEATYYDADGTGNCSFEATGDRMVAAINGADYARAAWCGACLEVTGPRGVIVVRVVDQCPGCKRGGLDLGRAAFARLAPLDQGRIQISWRPVPCDVVGPVAYRFKAGSNAFWTAIQVRNHRYPVTKLEARDDRGTWKPIRRAAYNYFVAPDGLGKGPYALRVTDLHGQTLVDDGIAAGDAVSRAGAAQFPTCLEPRR